MTNHDGGPAFPHEVYDSLTRLRHPRQGMTMRQWYKGMALSGLLADPEETLCHAAINAAALADELLAEDAASAKGQP